MDEPHLKSIEKEFQRISDSFRAAVENIGCLMDGALETLHITSAAECSLAAVSNWSFVRVLSPVANELAEMTVYGYAEYLDQARAMILEGKDIPDVLCYFDMMLYNLKQGGK